MVFLISLLVTLGLTFLEISVSHYFQFFNASAFFTLAFLVGLSIRSRNYFQIILAGLAGLVFDFASLNTVPIFTIIFILTVIIGRVFFYRKTSNKIINPFVLLLLISTSLIYLSSLPILFRSNFVGWQNYVVIFAAGTVLTLVIGLIEYRLFEPYFNWLDERTEK